MNRTSNPLIVAISSRALFDLEQSHRIFEESGVDEYCRYQIERENELLEPGVAFLLVKKLLALNSLLQGERRVEVVLISRNSADTGLRIFNSINHYKLDISRAAFSGGESPYRYVQPFQANLFLSTDPLDVVNALDAGIAAATILPSQAGKNSSEQLRIAFDGDAVLFSDDAERVFRERGLAEFAESERSSAHTPLPGGPFKDVLAALHAIQSEFPASESPIRTALVTARAAPAHERVIRTLRAWDIRID
jgi:5'-nucleotidase